MALDGVQWQRSWLSVAKVMAFSGKGHAFSGKGYGFRCISVAKAMDLDGFQWHKSWL